MTDHAELIARLRSVERLDEYECDAFTREAMLDAADALESQEREIARLREALRTIQQWDCLNPPRADLLGDLPWLRGIVDAALASQEEKP